MSIKLFDDIYLDVLVASYLMILVDQKKKKKKKPNFNCLTHIKGIVVTLQITIQINKLRALHNSSIDTL